MVSFHAAQDAYRLMNLVDLLIENEFSLAELFLRLTDLAVVHAALVDGDVDGHAHAGLKEPLAGTPDVIVILVHIADQADRRQQLPFRQFDA